MKTRNASASKPAAKPPQAIDRPSASRRRPATRRRILIAGGGVTGLCLAIALRHGLGDSAEILLAERGAAAAQADHRGWAVTAASRRMLEALGAWQSMAPAAAPILRIEVTDSRTRDVVRPVFLRFDEARGPDDPFAHVVIADVMRAALEETAAKAGVTLLRDSVAGFATTPGRIETELERGGPLSCDLLVAADGARSKLRALASIGFVSWPYGQSGIVASITHERPHEGVAVEHFLPAGPFARLPLTDDAAGRPRSSLVWTEQKDDAETLSRLPDDLLITEIESRMGLVLGEITLCDRPRAFPLGFGLARRFHGERLALLGDAAHQVHPIAGQGFNLGFKDVAALAEVVVEAARLGLDIGSQTVLARYEAMRRADTVAMAMGMDALNRLFSNDALPVRLVRDFGLGVVDRLPGLKRAFIAQAAGEAGHLPRLLRGEAL